VVRTALRALGETVNGPTVIHPQEGD